MWASGLGGGVAGIGTLIAAERRRRGWSQARLAARLAELSRRPTLTRHEVSRWERGKRTPRFWLPQLARAFELPVTVLEQIANGAQLPAVASAATLVSPPLDDQVAELVTDSDVSPIERLRSVCQVLAETEQAVGPNRLIPLARRYVGVTRQLRRTARGTDLRELHRVGTRFAGMLSWLYLDTGDVPAAQYWSDRALEWAHLVGDPAAIAFMLLGKGAQAAELGDDVDAVGAAEAAATMVPPVSPLAVLAHAGAGYAYALQGVESESDRSFEQADEAVRRGALDVPDAWAYFLNDFYVPGVRARSSATLGRCEAAVSEYESLTSLSARFRRKEGIFLARMASTWADAGEPERAAHTGGRALAVAVETGSRRALAELTKLRNALGDWRRLPAVREFRTELAGFST